MNDKKLRTQTYSQISDEIEKLQHRAFMAGKQRAKIFYDKIQQFKEKQYIDVEALQKEIGKKDLEIEVLRGNVTLLEKQKRELKQKLWRLKVE